MNREFKFRAWNKAQQIMHPNCGFHPSMASDLAAEDDYYNTHEEGRWIISPSFDNYVLMQYTGLKDKNGTEIYEGDILIIADAHFDGYADEGDIFSEEIKSDITSEVVFTEGCFQIYYEEGAPIPLFGYTSDSEIIGNIHQNPELLHPELLTPKQ